MEWLTLTLDVFKLSLSILNSAIISRLTLTSDVLKLTYGGQPQFMTDD